MPSRGACALVAGPLRPSPSTRPGTATDDPAPNPPALPQQFRGQGALKRLVVF
ncbi:hypothetical protein [Nannocystis punicea]|uniref:Uncharacterized protein n=1 Tax=Nannocystis punicea TaxID=2995304 RepID=A0ABY7H340_9BACT|nr:hypothetical protein [Nannocystis poenicansa]WAS93666.1 hypothetical protein O0S08_46635 [Nannocystis poenicansa]